MIVRCVPVGPLATNCYIVGCEGSADAIVIDPGGNPEEILAALRAGGMKCRMIVNTHGHADHIMANGAIREATGAPIAVHREDARRLTDPAASLSFALADSSRGPSSPSPPPDMLLEEGDSVEVGPAKLRVIHTPGHTPGSISLEGEGVLFSGDTLFAGGGIGRTDLPGGSPGALAHALKTKIFVLPDETRVYPGHGPSTTIGAERWAGGSGGPCGSGGSAG